MTVSLAQKIRDLSFQRILRFWHLLPGWVCVTSVLVAITAGLWLVAKPAYSKVRKWRIEGNFQDALRASKSNDPSKARDLAISVAKAGDTRIEVLYLIERSMHALEDPGYSQFAAKLLNHPQCAQAERLAIFRRIALTLPHGLVQSHWLRLSAADRDHQPIRLTLVDRLIADGEFSDVLGFLNDLPINPPVPEVAKRRIHALIGQNTPQSCETAQTRLVLLWETHPESAVDWCGLLERVPIEYIDPWILNPIRKQLAQGLPENAGRGELMDARIQWATKRPSGNAAVIDQAVLRWTRDAPLALCGFLTALDQHERIISTFTDESLSGNPDLLRAHLDSLSHLNRHRELSASLDLHGNLLPPGERSAYTAVAAHQSGDTAKMRRCWNDALNEGMTSDRPDDLLELYRFARQSDMAPEADRALLAAIKAGRGPLPSYRALAPNLQSIICKGAESDLMGVISQYLKFEPWNPQLVSLHCLLTALLDLQKPTELIPAMIKLAEQFPKENQVVSVLATLYLLADQTAEAEKTWKRLAVAPTDLTIGFRVAHLATMILTRQLDAADPSALAIPWDELLPSERKHFQSLLKFTGSPRMDLKNEPEDGLFEGAYK